MDPAASIRPIPKVGRKAAASSRGDVRRTLRECAGPRRWWSEGFGYLLAGFNNERW